MEGNPYAQTLLAPDLKAGSLVVSCSPISRVVALPFSRLDGRGRSSTLGCGSCSDRTFITAYRHRPHSLCCSATERASHTAKESFGSVECIYRIVCVCTYACVHPYSVFWSKGPLASLARSSRMLAMHIAHVIVKSRIVPLRV